MHWDQGLAVCEIRTELFQFQWESADRAPSPAGPRAAHSLRVCNGSSDNPVDIPDRRRHSGNSDVRVHDRRRFAQLRLNRRQHVESR